MLDKDKKLIGLGSGDSSMASAQARAFSRGSHHMVLASSRWTPAETGGKAGGGLLLLCKLHRLPRAQRGLHLRTVPDLPGHLVWRSTSGRVPGLPVLVYWGPDSQPRNLGGATLQCIQTIAQAIQLDKRIGGVQHGGLPLSRMEC